MMRNAIRDNLLVKVAELNDVYEPHVAGPESKKPYGVIKQGTDTDENDWAGFRRVVEIWPYVSRTTFTKVDDLQNKIVKALDKQMVTDTVTGEVFSCVYLGTAGDDVVDHEWDAITRGLRFAVFALQPVEPSTDVASDTWITALKSWSDKILNPDPLNPTWSIYENRFPLGYKRPCILWRLNDYRAQGLSRSVFEISKEIVGHVVTSAPNDRIASTSALVEQMMSDIKVPLDTSTKKYMTVIQPRGDFRADGLNRGQITVRLTRKTSRLKDDIPIMQVIDSSGNLEV
jgi:hypothetical protein